MRTKGLVIALSAAAFVGLSAGSMAQLSQPHDSIIQKWLGSGHADSSSPSFTHWDGEEMIPGSCANCHSGEGFRDFYGLDGSAVGTVDHPVAPGGVVDCATCHTDGLADINAVLFPSGMRVSTPGSSRTCLTCHQGRESGGSVAAATATMDDDAVIPELSFINPHYAAAGAMMQGSLVGGGYQYPGKSYMGRFTHVPPLSTCTDCHDPHSLEVEVSSCVRCHGTDDPRAIRTSAGDHDGDGERETGIHAEIAALSATLLDAIETYSTEVTPAAIAYSANYPYFMVAEGEENAGSPFASWTPRLLRAAYNYKFVTSDPGAYAHNPHYAIQLLHDSITDLSAATGARYQIGERPN